MFQFPLHNGRHYLTLNEASERLGISKEDVLYNLANEALIYLKCRAVAKSDFNDNDYDIEAIKWIEGLFWLPVDAYVELRFLLNNEITSISFSELRPHSIFVLNTGYFNGDATQRCHVTCEDWLYIKYPDVADYVLRSVDDLYFWEDTVEGFAEQNGFNYVVPKHLLSLDVVAKQIKNNVNTNKELPQELNEKTINTIKKSHKQRVNPVKEVMLNLITTKPTITKTEMWAELQKMARANTSPFIDEKNEHILIYVTGGNAENDTKPLTKDAFGKRYDRIKLTITDDKYR